MKKRFFLLFQYILPQQLLSAMMGRLAESRSVKLKNFMISRFCKRYNVDLSEANSSNLADYPSFNSFFIRELKPGSRPIVPGDDTIASPADGTIAQIGSINQGQLLQAKGFHFTLDGLLAQAAEASSFLDGKFATLYLAPHNYHRVHMPLAGKLVKTIYVPGKLFSVNAITSASVPNLYARNERLIAFFETQNGLMAVILVGAMIVGSIQTVWMTHPIKSKKPIVTTYADGMSLSKGQDLGHFKMGSTVVLLFNNHVSWEPRLTPNTPVKTGQLLGKILK